jgi:hypothetical protein
MSSIGCFASALTENQIIAAVISFVILMSLMLICHCFQPCSGSVTASLIERSILSAV